VPGTKTGQADRVVLYESRFAELLGRDQWELEGRLALNDSRDGGSGHFSWQKQGEASSMGFRGTFGRGAWRLSADGDGAVLEFADGEIFRAPSVSQLVGQRLGWEIPVDALTWWVRGLTAPGDWAGRELDELGQLMRLSQFGWVIECGKYTDKEGALLPLKLTARRDTYTVKLAIRDWNLVSGTVQDE
jgi:outer membrane lipoprotein LolB